MATIFKDAKSNLLLDFKERNTSVNAEYYGDVLQKLQASLRNAEKSEWRNGAFALLFLL